jgi:RNA polymerase-binding transcription factor DksA
MHLTDDQLQELRQKLSVRGRANDTDVPFAEPGDEPQERMKRFLGVLQAKMRAIRDGSGDYGHCRSCQADIPYDLLAREPWRETCASCA